MIANSELKVEQFHDWSVFIRLRYGSSFEVVRKLTNQELREAEQKAAAVARARQWLDRARIQLCRAASQKVDQNSSRWAILCNNVESALDQVKKTDQEEADWWRSKNFNV